VAKDDAKKDGTPINFEKSLDELESLVQKMEQGGLTLEESLAQFQRGIELARACQKALSEAQQRVEVLLEKDGELGEAPFDPEQQ
jgi:exodeoxyribonuclease VII small subunit